MVRLQVYDLTTSISLNKLSWLLGRLGLGASLTAPRLRPGSTDTYVFDVVIQPLPNHGSGWAERVDSLYSALKALSKPEDGKPDST